MAGGFRWAGPSAPGRGRVVSERFEDYVPYVLITARKIAKRNKADAEELFQEGMLALSRKWDKFDATRSSRKTWVITVSRYAMADALREGTVCAELPFRVNRHAYREGVKVKVFRLDKLKNPSDRPMGVLSHDQPLPDEPEDTIQLASQLVGRPLSDREKRAVVLCFHEGMPHCKAAEVLGIHPSTVSLIIQKLCKDAREHASHLSRRVEHAS